jgi:DNA-directed RNA polymerase alpha subunit
MSLVPTAVRGKASVIARAHLAAVEQAKKDPFVLIAAMQQTVADEIAKGLTDSERLAWKPWSDEVTRMVDRLQADQKLIDTDGWELAFTEIAEGLGGGR